MKKCPFCAEEIQDEAILCRYCNSVLSTSIPIQQNDNSILKEQQKPPIVLISKEESNKLEGEKHNPIKDGSHNYRISKSQFMLVFVLIILFLILLLTNNKTDNSKSTSPNSGTVEYAGKTYHSEQIGEQCWLKENLDVGTMVTGATEQTNNRTIEKYCYDDNPANCTTYGGLYQWNEAMQYSTTEGTQGICPSGWHIPTTDEWLTLSISVKDNGNALKAVGQGAEEGAGTNTSGFSALLSGGRADNGYFGTLAYGALFWSSAEDDAAYARELALNGIVSSIYYAGSIKTFGISIRCLKD